MDIFLALGPDKSGYVDATKVHKLIENSDGILDPDHKKYSIQEIEKLPVPVHARYVQFDEWIQNASELDSYTQIFKQFEKFDRVSSADLRDLLSSSGLEERTLFKIWSMLDIAQQVEYGNFIALFCLVTSIKRGKPMPEILPLSLHNLIEACKTISFTSKEPEVLQFSASVKKIQLLADLSSEKAKLQERVSYLKESLKKLSHQLIKETGLHNYIGSDTEATNRLQTVSYEIQELRSTLEALAHRKKHLRSQNLRLHEFIHSKTNDRAILLSVSQQNSFSERGFMPESTNEANPQKFKNPKAFSQSNWLTFG
jgi:hypothetical protein